MNDNDNALDTKPTAIPPLAGPTTVNSSTPDAASPLKVTTEVALPTFDITSSQESTRAKIALYFTYFFSVAMMLAFIGPFLVALLNPGLVMSPLEVSKSLVTEIASVLAGPVGFIVGFYFKQTTSGK